ncbi:hypothetical protein B0H15DRAFT_468129 [Mycena belliarum]|uniref:Uncharacterized protein n=1 Tax=Mycena belliarum TaxID=1033014 RepID=A0AAD6XQT8_9AGAR|nr:hypothetical protein B0H15DRAFT_468129 [Mycena belliae]
MCIRARADIADSRTLFAAFARARARARCHRCTSRPRACDAPATEAARGSEPRTGRLPRAAEMRERTAHRTRRRSADSSAREGAGRLLPRRRFALALPRLRLKSAPLDRGRSCSELRAVPAKRVGAPPRNCALAAQALRRAPTGLGGERGRMALGTAAAAREVQARGLRVLAEGRWLPLVRGLSVSGRVSWSVDGVRRLARSCPRAHAFPGARSALSAHAGGSVRIPWVAVRRPARCRHSLGVVRACERSARRLWALRRLKACDEVVAGS